MKKLIPVLVCLLSLSAFAQRDGKIAERIKTQKVAFITEKLNLTSEEAQDFWPIYNEVEAKKQALRKASNLKRKVKNPDELTDKEADELLNEMLDIEDQKHQLNRELATKLSDVISSKKILRLMHAEREFDRRLFKRLNDMRKKRKGRN